ncbi:Putative arylsulfatase regulatory protein [Methanosarcina barkeri str. Wiesmoor]|uniref:Arylsulfatase regulator n=2 Tax=Methanosarcina barkeri TaxID=2208 RepID=Q467H4_METBF|nr:anaerobic sulfatase maturase [Methanosarcina barkeri]AKB50907.1 Putative arylsulfatase regulatory protein [Methanosarcina barkeri str. Wiesmoor]
MTKNHLPPRIHVLAKPTGAICNLACSYCFFLAKEALYPGSKFRMSDKVLENYIRQLIEAHHSPQVTVAWQGGEPTLMGIDFYRRAIELQEKYRKPGISFENTMQTNGTLLDDEWCRFFKENNFLIGISIDGPRELHDAYRVDKKGNGTFDQVMKGLRLLQKHGVEYNVLTTVNRANADYPLEVYRFLRDEAGTDWMQFIPVVERINEEGHTLYQRGDTVSNRSVQPEQFGNFLNHIFDEWVRNDVGKIFVQTFEASARRWLGMPSGMCVFEETCGTGLALEHNGDLYSCDHFVEPDYLLGNIMEKEISELAALEKQYRFGQDKCDTLPQVCRECEVLFACQGECPKNRFLTTPAGETGLNYLCEGWKAFFRHIDFPMQILAGLIRRGYPASEVMRVMALEDAFARAGRNDPCPCGSGRKFKRCHGLRKTNAKGETRIR